MESARLREVIARIRQLDVVNGFSAFMGLVATLPDPRIELTNIGFQILFSTGHTLEVYEYRDTLFCAFGEARTPKNYAIRNQRVAGEMFHEVLGELLGS